MVIYDKGQLGQAAKKSGFVRDTFEKVMRFPYFPAGELHTLQGQKERMEIW